MKKFRSSLMLCVGTILLCFCTETEVHVDYVIINDSSYDIKLERFNTYGVHYLRDSIIEKNSFLLVKLGDQATDFSLFKSPYVVNVDSVQVTFLDTLSVMHGSELYDVLRSIRDQENYVLEKSSEGYRKYTYTFTNVDMEEAVQINLSQ